MNEKTNHSLTGLTSASGVSTLTLNREAARNALSIDLLESLHARVDSLERSKDKVVVITGAGKAFCAGMDLKAVLSDTAAAHRLLSLLGELCIKIRALPQVTLACVNGAAIGGGCGLACVCDLAITHADSKLGFPEVDLGVCPAVVAPWLVRKIGPGRARKVLLSGGLMSGAEAHAIGMVDAVAASREALAGEASRMAERIATGGAMALQATKSLLNTLDDSLDHDLAREGAALSARVLATPEAQAMLRAKMSS
ncbi:MAG: enoyl-CoA hydratase/isomerase family protein [Phycisphaerales bacterium]|nr:MAG: enoyl-CoA hydratase/isomerase family protein [Phycisphaerales bacterium]